MSFTEVQEEWELEERVPRLSEVMTPRKAVMFVYAPEVLGPLVLDRLYKSGQTQFPVLDETGKQILGSIRTEELNSLAVKESRQAREILDTRVFFMREDYTLEQAFAAYLRTAAPLYIVVNAEGRMTGMVTAETLQKAVLGRVYTDDFSEDGNLLKVVHRKLE